MTVIRDEYDDYRRAALNTGATEAEVEEAIDLMRAEKKKIDALVCPECGAALTRAEDPRQAGMTKVPGKWFNYRCVKRCGWFADRKEPIGEN